MKRTLCLFIVLLPFYIFGQIPDLLLASKAQVGGGLGPELYTVNNALATGANEADATTGLTNQGMTSIESIESSPSPQDGGSLIRAIAGSPPDRFEEGLALDNGVTYQISYWAWYDTSGSGRTQLWLGFVTSPDQLWSTTPTYYTHTVTTSSASQTLRFYDNDADGYIYVDGLSIKEVL